MVKRIFPSLSLVAVLCALTFGACASPSAKTRTAYRLQWTATRTADKSPLITVSMNLAVGQPSTTNTDSVRPTEERPAFPRFFARLSATRASGVLQLITRAELRETSRNKKGKLKVNKRNIGALIPIHAGETQLVSLPTDPVHLEVRLERE